MGKAFAYLIWGVEDRTHTLVGTTFDPQAAKVGGEELENWLLRSLSPKIHFHFHPVEVDGYRLVLLEIGRAFRHPVQFQNQELLFAHRPLNRMDKADRVRTCYLHACLKYVNGEYMTNTSPAGAAWN